jgi:HNH endonuclease
MLDRDTLRDLLQYDPELGTFAWRSSRSGQKARVGCIKDGYLVIRLLGRVYRAHRLAWLYAHGHWPAHQIDHIDGDRLNNQLDNLRDVTRAENSQNRDTAGVYRRGNTWRALIGAGGVAHKQTVHLGSFRSKEEARAAYLHAKSMMHPGFVPSRAGVAKSVDASDSKSDG